MWKIIYGLATLKKGEEDPFKGTDKEEQKKEEEKKEEEKKEEEKKEEENIDEEKEKETGVEEIVQPIDKTPTTEQ